MSILGRRFGRSRDRDDSQSDQGSPADAGQVPLPGYDRLDPKQIGDRLNQLSQVELAELEAYERSHGERPEVLNKLRYMRGPEPLPGYDALSPEQIADELAAADTETVKAVRDYERKFAHRQQVLDDAARFLPTSSASASEERDSEARSERVREGFADRDETADGLADRRSSPDD